MIEFSEEELYRLNIYHITDDEYCKKQLGSLLGLLNEDQDRDIIKSVYGNRILDIGAGNGVLSKSLKEAGYEVTAIEPHAHTRELAKKWNDVDELPYNIYSTPFDDNYFDTVILRECGEHLDLVEAGKEIKRICNTRIIVFGANVNPLITLARIIRGQEEFNLQTIDYYQTLLKELGYPHQHWFFRDSFALPISGGYQHKQLIPRNKSIECLVLSVDKVITKFLLLFGIESFFFWRYLLVADKRIL